MGGFNPDDLDMDINNMKSEDEVHVNTRKVYLHSNKHLLAVLLSFLQSLFFDRLQAAFPTSFKYKTLQFQQLWLYLLKTSSNSQGD